MVRGAPLEDEELPTDEAPPTEDPALVGALDVEDPTDAPPEDPPLADEARDTPDDAPVDDAREVDVPAEAPELERGPLLPSDAPDDAAVLDAELAPELEDEEPPELLPVPAVQARPHMPPAATMSHRRVNIFMVTPLM